jgi:hypothetical protein
LRQNISMMSDILSSVLVFSNCTFSAAYSERNTHISVEQTFKAEVWLYWFSRYCVLVKYIDVSVSVFANFSLSEEVMMFSTKDCSASSFL